MESLKIEVEIRQMSAVYARSSALFGRQHAYGVNAAELIEVKAAADISSAAQIARAGAKRPTEIIEEIGGSVNRASRWSAKRGQQ
ncbi:hypothetical protein [Bradyrhizobium paxllaeri]|uniref:hypothetical protein n=1 Tax=Bradyrhizobium paxllaeri TaxID=190148 RepID=UPI00081066FB|nr:hypothetical protein [Bradyrhizobium paxllaeri]